MLEEKQSKSIHCDSSGCGLETQDCVGAGPESICKEDLSERELTKPIFVVCGNVGRVYRKP